MVIIEAPQDPEHLVAPLPPLFAGRPLTNDKNFHIQDKASVFPYETQKCFHINH